jgi:hypothetical protein
MKTQPDRFTTAMAVVLVAGMLMWFVILPSTGLLWMVGFLK